MSPFISASRGFCHPRLALCPGLFAFEDHMHLREFVEEFERRGLDPVIEYAGPRLQQVSCCDGRVMFERHRAQWSMWPCTWEATDNSTKKTCNVGPVKPQGWQRRLAWWWLAQKSRMEVVS